MGALDIFFGSGPGTPETVPLEKFEYEKQNLDESLQNTIAADKGAFAESSDLMEDINAFQADQATKGKNATIKGFSEFQESLGNTFRELSSDGLFELPDAFKDQLKQEAAEKGVTGGFGGSDFGDFDAIRNFGREGMKFAMDKSTQQQNILRTLDATDPGVSPISPMSFLVSGSEGFQADRQQESERVKWDAEYKIRSQEIAQDAANVEAAAKGSTGIISSIMTGATTGGQIGGPWGAVIGGVAGAGAGLAQREAEKKN